MKFLEEASDIKRALLFDHLDIDQHELFSILNFHSFYFFSFLGGAFRLSQPCVWMFSPQPPNAFSHLTYPNLQCCIYLPIEVPLDVL